MVFRRARNFYHLIDSAVTTNFYCFNMSLKWPLLPIFIPFPPNFAQRALRARRARSAGASTGNTQHTCAGPTECARPHVHPPPAQHPTHNAAAHTTAYSSVAAVINSYSLSAQLGVALRPRPLALHLHLGVSGVAARRRGRCKFARVCRL